MSDNAHHWTTGQVVELLRRVELLAGLPERDLETLAGVVEGRALEAGETVFMAGEAASDVWFVVEGSVELRAADADPRGDSGTIVAAGGAFGEEGLLSGAPRSHTARAIETSTLARLSRASFEEQIGGSLAMALVRSLAGAAGHGAEPAAGAQARVWEVSRAMQAGLLPRSAPRLEGYETAAGTTREETGRGGSVWDWITLADGRNALLTLDVRQEGFPAAHHIGVARAVLRAVAAEHETVPELLARANDVLAAAAVEGVAQFVEAGVLAVSRESVEWASAGRVPAGVIRRDGTFEELGAHGPPLGMMDGFTYTAQRIGMSTGDTAFVLSHGSQGLFKGAADLVAQLAGKPPGDVVTTLHSAIRKAQGERRTETSVLYARRH